MSTIIIPSSLYTRMMIVEAMSEEQARDVRNAMDAHAADLEIWPGHVDTCRLSEEDGRMVILETTWDSREIAIKYHTSREYRHLVERVNPYIAGEPVIKLFRRYQHKGENA